MSGSGLILINGHYDYQDDHCDDHSPNNHHYPTLEIGLFALWLLCWRRNFCIWHMFSWSQCSTKPYSQLWFMYSITPEWMVRWRTVKYLWNRLGEGFHMMTTNFRLTYWFWRKMSTPLEPQVWSGLRPLGPFWDRTTSTELSWWGEPSDNIVITMIIIIIITMIIRIMKITMIIIKLVYTVQRLPGGRQTSRERLFGHAAALQLWS